MSILDDAIREHLDLKRRHGADESELKRLEDEAFGPPARPEEGLDPYSEAPTEFLVAPGAEAGEPAPELDVDEQEAGGRRVDVADLQEPPPRPAEEAEEGLPKDETPVEPEAEEPEPPAEEEHPAMEHEAITELPGAEPDAAEPEAGQDAAERHAITEQPTEIFDVEGEFDAAGEAASPSDEQLAEAELGEPRLAPVDPIEGIEASAAAAPPSDEELEQHADEFDEFFSEQRLSDELNQALEAPLEDEPGFPATEDAEPRPVEPDQESAPGPDQEPAPDPEESDADESPAAADPEESDAGEEHPAAHHEADHQDALEDTPDFLADDPDDDSLWFEQKPPKDIDFGD